MERATWFRILVILGLFGMVIGALDPLEGSVIILPCVAIAALGVWMGHTRRRKLVYAGVALVAWGVAGMFLLSAIGGVGGTSGRSAWCHPSCEKSTSARFRPAKRSTWTRTSPSGSQSPSST